MNKIKRFLYAGNEYLPIYLKKKKLKMRTDYTHARNKR